MAIPYYTHLSLTSHPPHNNFNFLHLYAPPAPLTCYNNNSPLPINIFLSSHIVTLSHINSEALQHLQQPFDERSGGNIIGVNP